MKTQTRECSKIERRLALGGDLIRASLSAHIERCSSCQAAAAAYRRVTSGLSSLTSDEAGLRLSASRRASILREVRVLAPATAVWSARVPAYATLLAASLIVGFAYLSSFTPVQEFSARPARASDPTDVRVSQVGKDVVLEWSDGRQESYTVRQATSAKLVYSAPGVQVRGHRYVDRSPSDAKVVYYLVE